MDILFIKQLSVFTTIGAYEWERTIKQELLLDIEIGLNNYIAYKSDQIEHCLDYSIVSQKVIKHIEKQKFKLIERVAEETSDIILNQFDVSWLRIKIYKPNAVKQAKEISIIIERIKSTLD
ncbi:MAG: dihydroneopterin aldolase [Arsenophonus sp. ER-QC15-MAG3]